LLFVFFAASCKRESRLPEKNNSKVTTERTVSNCAQENDVYYELGNINIAYEPESKMLRFGNWEDFHNAVEILDQQYEEHNEAREQQIPNGLTHEQMDDLDELVNFDEFYPLRTFESQFRYFKSKREQLEKLELTWLDNNMTGLDPDDIDFTFDNAENTLFNENYQVKIGCEVYKVENNKLDTSENNIVTESNNCINGSKSKK
jgi:hypothetical protein